MTLTRINRYFHEGSFAPLTIIAIILAVALPIMLALFVPGPDIDTYLAWGLTAITGLGVFATIWTWYDSLLEAKTVQPDDTALGLIAKANVRREALRIAVLLGLFWIGFSILSMRADPTVNRSVFIELAIALVGNSLLDRLERRDTGRALRAEIQAERAREAASSEQAKEST